MSSVSLTDGRVLHIPGTPFIVDATSLIIAPADDDLAAYVPLIHENQLLLFTKRLVDGARKRRFAGRYRDVNRARLLLARMCIDRALAELAGGEGGLRYLALSPPPCFGLLLLVRECKTYWGI